jgi:hypothetical protein
LEFGERACMKVKAIRGSAPLVPSNLVKGIRDR